MAQKLLSSKAKYCRSRQKDPRYFEKGTLRTTPIKRGVKKVTGCPKGSTYAQKKGVGCRTFSGRKVSTELQTILYKAGSKACPLPGGKELSKGFPMRKMRKKRKKNPQFGLKHNARPYKCKVCGNVQAIKTNHTDDVWEYCWNCSWKGVGFDPGNNSVRMFGAIHRRFKFARGAKISIRKNNPMKNPPSRTYTYFQDPGHGWIAVKVDELQQLQIEQKISTSSYLKGKTAYLEEDSDAATWYQAYFAQWGEKPKFKEKHTNKTSPIRSYPRYYRVVAFD